MILFLSKLKSEFKKQGPANSQAGMTYVELIVVLSIFSTMSTVVLFSYGEFQAKVDIKNLANDIALKVVEAQKDAIFGKFPSLAQQASITSTWKPSYGVYFDLSTDNQGFIYFADLQNPQPQNNVFDGNDCTGECIEKISITKGNTISSIDVFYLDGSNDNIPNATISFTRPDATAIIKSLPALNSTKSIDFLQIKIISPKSSQAYIKLYASGRIQIN